MDIHEDIFPEDPNPWWFYAMVGTFVLAIVTKLLIG